MEWRLVWRRVENDLSVAQRSARFNVFVLDCDFGLGVISRGQPEDRLESTRPEIEQMDDMDLEKRRESLLNLKPPLYLSSFLDSLTPRGVADDENVSQEPAQHLRI